MDMATRPVSIRLDDDDMDLLEALGFVTGLSKNKMLRGSVEQFIRRNESLPGVQEAAKARRLARESGVNRTDLGLEPGWTDGTLDEDEASDD
jgi:predicted transcriptional regulator